VRALAILALAVVVTTALAADKTSCRSAPRRRGRLPLYGGAVAERQQRRDPTLDVQPKNTKGSTENVPLLERAPRHRARAGEVAHEALAGIGRAPAN
jgi:hypothetical protein